MHSEGLQGGEKNLGFTVSPTIAEVAASRETAIAWKDLLLGDAVESFYTSIDLTYFLRDQDFLTNMFPCVFGT